MLARVMRKWDEDGVADPDATAFGEFILKVMPWAGRRGRAGGGGRLGAGLSTDLTLSCC
jgi:hypothetical protein